MMTTRLSMKGLPLAYWSQKLSMIGGVTGRCQLSGYGVIAFGWHVRDQRIILAYCAVSGNTTHMLFRGSGETVLHLLLGVKTWAGVKTLNVS